MKVARRYLLPKDTTPLFVRSTMIRTMKSGATDTCLGNTILNIVVHLFAMTTTKEIDDL
jgi:hypothetical protein